MTSALRKDQARHFDSHTPFTPASRELRASGFAHPYILKDLLISQAMLPLLPSPGLRVLDVGCGKGILLDRLASSYGTVGFGVDISKQSLRGLRLESVHSHRAACSEGEKLPFPDDCFDLAVSFDVLEHVEEPKRVLGEMLRVLKPGGGILCYAVSCKNAFTFNWFLMKALDALRVDHWSWAGHDPDLLVDPAKTYAHLVHVGCKIDKFELFHAFFTIMLDQVILALLWVASKLGVFNVESSSHCSVGRWLLTLTSGLSRAMFRPLRILDAPWTRRGVSNGFLVVGTKCQPREDTSSAEGIYRTPERSQAIAPFVTAPIGRRGSQGAIEARERSGRT